MKAVAGRAKDIRASAGRVLSGRRKVVFAILVLLLFFGGTELLLGWVVWMGWVDRPPTETLRDAWAAWGLRVDPLLGWGLLPNCNQPWGGTMCRSNSLGLRDEEIPDAAPTGEFRILCLGDSTVMGFGVEAEETLANRLEESLRDHAAQRVQVINAGVIGYSSCQCLLYLREQGLALRPNVVIVETNFNDRRAVSPGGEPDSEAYFRSTERRLRMREVLHHSMIYSFLRDALLSTDLLASGRCKRKEIQLCSAVPRVSPIHYEANVREIIRLSRTAGASVILVGLPDCPARVFGLRRAAEAMDRKAWSEAIPQLEQALDDDMYAIVAQRLLNRVYLEIGQPERRAQTVPVTYRFWSSADGYVPLCLNGSYIAILEKVGTELDVPVVIPAGQEADAPELYLDHAHLTSDGHVALARQLADIVTALPSFRRRGAGRHE